MKFSKSILIPVHIHSGEMQVPNNIVNNLIQSAEVTFQRGAKLHYTGNEDIINQFADIFHRRQNPMIQTRISNYIQDYHNNKDHHGIKTQKNRGVYVNRAKHFSLK